MHQFAIGEPCAWECRKTIDGICYRCAKCGIHCCYTCPYNTQWKCPICGTKLT